MEKGYISGGAAGLGLDTACPASPGLEGFPPARGSRPGGNRTALAVGFEEPGAIERLASRFITRASRFWLAGRPAA